MSDVQTGLLGTGAGGTILTVLYFLYKTCNNKRVHSRCCGKDVDVEFQVQEMTPPERGLSRFERNNPLSVIVPNPVG
jgi:hypothetical protein